MNIPASLPEPVPNRTSPFRPLVLAALDRLADLANANMALRVHTVCDPDLDHYLLIAEGWQGYRRIYRTLVHIALLGNNLHVYEDGTIDGIAEQLYAQGVPREQIICEWTQLPPTEVVDC